MYCTQLRIEEELAERFKEAAAKDRRSLNAMITILIEKYLEEQEKKTKEGE